MAGTFLVRWRTLHHMEALLLDMALQQVKQGLRRGLRHRAEINLGCCRRGHDGSGPRADVGRLHAADSERRVLKGLLVVSADFLGFSNAKTLAQGRLVV